MQARVLIVDDSAVMRKVIISILKQMGINDTDIMEACDGKEAVEVSGSNPFDLILMDWNMPNMLGIDAVKAIRAQGNTTPILMVTTEGEKMNVVHAIQSGANNYMVKPFNADDFREKVEALLN